MGPRARVPAGALAAALALTWVSAAVAGRPPGQVPDGWPGLGAVLYSGATGKVLRVLW